VDHYWPVLTTPVKDDLTGINDTGTACIAGVIDTSGAPTETLTVRLSLKGTISKKRQTEPNLFDIKPI
jgi:hypothetical protein